MKAIIIIPARFGSTRLKRKMLLNKTGKYLVQHTYEQALKSREAEAVIIATDSLLVYKAVKSFGGKSVMTSPKHTSGSERIAEVAKKLNYPIIVNLQGDEPEIEPSAIDKAIKLARLKNIDIATLATPFRNKKELKDQSKVKVLIGKGGKAINFSRNKDYLLSHFYKGGLRGIKRHIGIYVYRRDALLRFIKLSPTVREKEERLEQLRALENGFKIKVGTINKAPVGIDTPKDYEAFVKRTER
jgi:3-deoxy-manno-octulosonate cytidylyltransferase (CMP-KDO synthetase)